ERQRLLQGFHYEGFAMADELWGRTPLQEHHISDWEETVEGRTRARRREVVAELEALTADFTKQHNAFLRTSGAEGSLMPEMEFMAEERVTLDVAVRGGHRQASSLGTAEWNKFFMGQTFSADVARLFPDSHVLNGGPVGHSQSGHSGSAEAGVAVEAADPAAGDGPVPAAVHGQIALAWRAAGRNYAETCRQAAAQGAVAVIIINAEDVTVPMGYAANEDAPPIPCAMIPKSFGEELEKELADGEEARASLSIVNIVSSEQQVEGGAKGASFGWEVLGDPSWESTWDGRLGFGTRPEDKARASLDAQCEGVSVAASVASQTTLTYHHGAEDTGRARHASAALGMPFLGRLLRRGATCTFAGSANHQQRAGLTDPPSSVPGQLPKMLAAVPDSRGFNRFSEATPSNVNLNLAHTWHTVAHAWSGRASSGERRRVVQEEEVEGMLTDKLVEDGIDESLLLRVKALQQELTQLDRALVFAREVCALDPRS
ncbi:hypothetical protein CYMTET_36472, partial [Cymbomonas tetramitiformis]